MNDASRSRRQPATDDSASSASFTRITAPAAREDSPHPTRERPLRVEHEQSHGAVEAHGFVVRTAPFARTADSAILREVEVRSEEALSHDLDSLELSTTQRQRVVMRRVRQESSSESVMDELSGACAVTGVALPELLRASHIEPWSECDSDAERLNVFNGLLLAAHLDAVFDRGLITFDEGGSLRRSAAVNTDLLLRVGMRDSDHLRWIAHEHIPFLAWRRRRLSKGL